MAVTTYYLVNAHDRVIDKTKAKSHKEAEIKFTTDDRLYTGEIFTCSVLDRNELTNMKKRIQDERKSWGDW